MITIGIKETRNDQFYRYQREIIQIRNSTKNRAQTEVINLEKISKQLKVNSGLLRKEFSKKLGVFANGNVLAGEFNVEKLENILQNFVENVVLCKKCKLPELNSKGTCRSCGKGKEGKKDEKKDENSNEIEEEISEEFSSLVLSESESNEEKEQSEYLNKLYDIRDKLKDTLKNKPQGSSLLTKVLLEEVDIAIDKIWAVPSHKWEKLKEILEKFLIYINSNCSV